MLGLKVGAKHLEADVGLSDAMLRKAGCSGKSVGLDSGQI